MHPHDLDHVGQDLGPTCGREDLALELPRWDELDFARRFELERHARACRSCGPALTMLKRADQWLDRRFAGPCPSSEDLYDFGRGPGSRALPAERRRAIEAHVAGCAECGELVATLASRPPVPIEWTPEGLVGAQEPARTQEKESMPTVDVPPATQAPILRPRFDAPARRRLRWLWIPAAAAAAVVTFVLVRDGLDAKETGAQLVAQVDVQDSVFPAPPTLRGETDAALRFPRDRVLATTTGELWTTPWIEIEPRADATLYRVELRRLGEGVFDRGATVWTIETREPAMPLNAEQARLLTPGEYTWEAWARVGDLDLPLGKRSFEVIVDGALIAMLDAARERDAGAATRAVLEALHQRGFLGDARAFARTLAPSAARDAYLQSAPGR